MVDINHVIINIDKPDYEKSPIILGAPRALGEGFVNHYPEQNKYYEQLRGQDWTEKEFAFEKCRIEFKTCDPIIANDMTETVLYQWETDFAASNTIAGIMACVCSSDQVWEGYQRISDNENIHKRTYKKIVEQSFDNPMEMLARARADRRGLKRLEVVGKVFGKAFEAAHRWALFQYDPVTYKLTDRERYQIFDAMFLYIVALLCMERGQFMPSFATTFGICDLDMFQPIGDAVQRIAQDELEIHVPFGRANLIDLLKTDRGRESYKTQRHLIIQMVNETIEREDSWVDITHADGHELPGVQVSDLKTFNHFGGTDIAVFLGIEHDVNFPLVHHNNLAYMAKRVNLASTQGSPMEVPPTSYMVNAVARDDADATFEDLEL